MFGKNRKMPWWWFILPAYITIWSLIFGSWNFIDGQGMFSAFGIDFLMDTPNAEFIVLNSASRYLGIAAALVVGVWLFRTPESMFTGLFARFVMDVFDLVSGLQSGIIGDPVAGSIQSFMMFLAPNLIAMGLLIYLTHRKPKVTESTELQQQPSNA